jgi:hypothetical protein
LDHIEMTDDDSGRGDGSPAFGGMDLVSLPLAILSSSTAIVPGSSGYFYAKLQPAVDYDSPWKVTLHKMIYRSFEAVSVASRSWPR